MIDRTPKPCQHPVANHQHGTYAAYTLDACRCLPCAFACHMYGIELRSRQRKGDAPMVDAEPVITHAKALMASGWTLRSIARVSGVSLTAVTRLACQPGTRRPARVTVETADAITALPLGVDQSYMIPAIGAARRIRALAAIGWSFRDVGATAGLSHRAIVDINTGVVQHVRPANHDSICRAYDKLWDQEPTGPCCGRMRGYAQRNGWAPPMAWDDDSIDDPEATPDLDGNGGTDRMSLYLSGMSDSAIAREEGISRDSVGKWRQRHGLKPNYRPRGRHMA